MLQKVEHPSHIHFDIETDNIQAEVERLSKLGVFFGLGPLKPQKPALPKVIRVLAAATL